MSENKPQRRIFPAPVNQPKQVTDVTIVMAPTINTLTSDALSIIQNEIARFKHKSQSGKLVDSEHRIIQGYLKALVELDRVSKAREDEMDLASMTDAEIVKMIETLRNKNQPKQGE